MDIQLKKKDIRDWDPISFWYCEIYNLTRPLNRIGYTAGTYGRNEDIYDINGATICTGYRPTGKRLKVKAGTIEKYEKRAEDILHKRELNREQRKEKILKLWDKLLKEAGN